MLESEDCREYLKGLMYPLDSRMGIVFSNFVNTSASADQFELELGQVNEGCDDAKTVISNFEVNEGVSFEPLPAEFIEGDVAPSLADCD